MENTTSALTQARSTTNGTQTGSNDHTPTDWRREAVDDLLRNRAEDGSPEFVLLAAFQRHLPDLQVRKFNENRERTMAALERLLVRLETLIAPAREVDRSDLTRSGDAIYGWWRGYAEDGTVFEIAQSPSYGNGDFVVAAEDGKRVEQLIREVIEDATKNTCRCLRFTHGMWRDAPEMQSEVDATQWNDIVLSPSLLSDIRQNIEMFFQQKELFHRLGFAWRRGILLVGPPGTGKTMVCKAAAQSHPEIPFLYVRDLIGNGDVLTTVFQQARRLAPCILAIEDMDGLVHQENRTMFLNELDGFRNNDGLLIIATSNHPERIDEALLKRPSRFDRVYHIGVPDQEERATYLRLLFSRSPMELVGVDTGALAEKVAEATGGFTPAFLKEAFLSAVLLSAQTGKTELNEDVGTAVLAQVDLLKKYLKKARNPEAFAEMLPGTAPEIGFRSRQ
ncbi:MAG: hypothetical protein OHK0029_17430 [Armatimonadaceae bacterium]